jgi:GT2 family glycosyltransferase
MIPNLIVPVLNRYDLLERMLASIDYPVRDLLVVDNNPNHRGKSERPKTVQNLRWLHLPSNLGVAGSWNLGVKLYPHDPMWTFASNDMWFRPGDLETLSAAPRDALTLSKYAPRFHTFAVGEAVVDAVGLFDERFYPAYCEDNDFEQRVRWAGFPVVELDVAPDHDNSSTLGSDPKLWEANQRTFPSSVSFYRRKTAGVDKSWGWTLGRRRAGEWL